MNRLGAMVVSLRRDSISTPLGMARYHWLAVDSRPVASSTTTMLPGARGPSRSAEYAANIFAGLFALYAALL